VPVPRRRREGEPAQQADQHHLELNHRQVLPDAGPGPVPERHVHACRPARRGPQASLSWCSIDLSTWMIVPRGTSRPPILTSVSTSRIISDAGGNRRRVSWITIVMILSWRRALTSSVAPPWQTSAASARACSCHSGCAASNIKHQIMVTSVVPCPAKYMPLQLPMMKSSASRPCR